ncbi:MAG: hypothetical protein EA425_12490 [Puniceicoccaceae bacterium]|nr:MAG: hypothetical protein EA425_12490 [Puniceicoccaceae bacterium]
MKAGRTFWRQALLTLPFFAFGFLSFAVVLAVLLGRPDLLTGEANQPALLALVHLFFLGGVASIIFGAAYQLIPLIAETRLRSLTLARMHLVLHAVALPGMVVGFWREDYLIVAQWGWPVALGMLFFVLNLAATLNRRSPWQTASITLASALFWLAVAAGLAGFYLAKTYLPMPPLGAGSILSLHATAGLIGFLFLTLAGATYRLLPMFLVTATRGGLCGWWSTLVVNAGLFLLVPALLLPMAGVTGVALLLLATGVVLFLAEVVSLVLRRSGAVGWPLRIHLLGLAGLLPLAILLGLLGGGRVGWLAHGPELNEVLLVALFGFGVLAPCILGVANRVVPFLVWQMRYAHRIGLEEVPEAESMANHFLVPVGFLLLMPVLPLLLLGFWMSMPVLLQIGLGFLAAAMLATLLNLVRLLRPVRLPGKASSPASSWPDVSSAPRRFADALTQ